MTRLISTYEREIHYHQFLFIKGFVYAVCEWNDGEEDHWEECVVVGKVFMKTGGLWVDERCRCSLRDDDDVITWDEYYSSSTFDSILEVFEFLSITS